jgi:type III restriction enzyme
MGNVSPVNYIVHALEMKDDISYEDCAELLHSLAQNAVDFYKSKGFTNEEIVNIVITHENEIIDTLYKQMGNHQDESNRQEKIVVSKGFTALQPIAFTAPKDAEPLDFKRDDFEKSKIGHIIFTGFKKCLYQQMKFDSDTERRFAIILERESEKWLKPAKNQFNIHYKLDGAYFDYVPDFVAETKDTIYMAETKALKEMQSPEVLAKKAAAEKWCETVTAYNKSIGKKPWKYLLIPDTKVSENFGLDAY